MNALQNGCLALLVVIGLFIHTSASDKTIEKDTIEIYKNVMEDKYSRHDILSYYKSKCHWDDKIEYLNCLRESATALSLGTTIQGSDSVRNVCCFFWNALECARVHAKCKAMFDVMLSHFLEHQLKDQCKAYTRLPNTFHNCEISQQQKDGAVYEKVSKEEEPALYVLRKAFQNIVRKAIN